MKFSFIVLLVVNALPLLGVAFWHWSLFSVLSFYWLEGAMLALWALPKLALAKNSTLPQPPRPPWRDRGIGLWARLKHLPRWARAQPLTTSLWHSGWPRSANIGFFALYFSIAFGAYGLLLWFVFDFADFSVDSMIVPALLLLLRFGGEFWVHFLGQKQYEAAFADRLVADVFWRLAVVHAVVFAGGVTARWLNAPIAAVAVLIALKTALDIAWLRRKNNK